MNKIFIAVALAAALYLGLGQRSASPPDISAPPSGARVDRAHDPIQTAFAEQQSGVPVEGEGTVVKVLKDDNEGSRHQRFLLKLPDGLTLLVAHNIDLAPRLDNLQERDTVAFNGIYEWNPKGGVIHWTHHDPSGRHAAGWLKHYGQISQ